MLCSKKVFPIPSCGALHGIPELRWHGDQPMTFHRAFPLSWIWALSIVGVWTLVAVHLAQPLWAQQSSLDLVPYGALKGEDFTWRESWRLIVSQWLHVKFPHMLLNVLIIAVVGQALERVIAPWLVVFVALAGGAVGQLLTVTTHPDAFISGASQAYAALCGFALVCVKPSQFGWWVAVIGVVVAACLDLVVSSDHALKVGHVAPFAFGVSAGLALSSWSRIRAGR